MKRFSLALGLLAALVLVGHTAVCFSAKLNLELTCSQPSFVPGGAQAPELVAKLLDSSGAPIAQAEIELSLARLVPWLSLSVTSASTMADGQARFPLAVSSSLAELDLATLPLSALFIARTSVGAQAATCRLEVPLAAALLSGSYVDSAMRLRSLSVLPQVTPRTALLAADTAGGNFHLLVTPTEGNLLLEWPPEAPCPLRYTVAGPLAAGSQARLGRFDLLTPEEHRERLSSLLSELMQHLPLSATGRTQGFAAARELSFEPGSGYARPVLGPGSLIKLPGSEGEFWAADPGDPEAPAPYPLLLRALGDLLWERLVEPGAFTRGQQHELAELQWSPWAALERPETAFAATRSEVVASLVLAFARQAHPEWDDSLYFRDADLAAYKDDAKALQLLTRPVIGSLIPGLSARAVLSLYGELPKNSSAQVLGDFLATAARYAELCPLRPHPARTLADWLGARSALGSPYKLPETGSAQNLAASYKLFGDTEQVSACYLEPLSQAATASLDGAPVDFSAGAVRLSTGAIAVEGGAVALCWPGATGVGNVAVLGPGAAGSVDGTARMQVNRGQAAGCRLKGLWTPPAAFALAEGALFAQVESSGVTKALAEQGQVSRYLQAGQQQPIAEGAGLLLTGVDQQQALPAEEASELRSQVLALIPPYVSSFVWEGQQQSGAPVAGTDLSPEGWLEVAGAGPLARISLCRALGADFTPEGAAWKFPSTLTALVLAFEMRGVPSPLRVEVQLAYEGNVRYRLTAQVHEAGQFKVDIAPSGGERFTAGEYSLRFLIDGQEVLLHPFRIL